MGYRSLSLIIHLLLLTVYLTDDKQLSVMIPVQYFKANFIKQGIYMTKVPAHITKLLPHRLSEFSAAGLSGFLQVQESFPCFLPVGPGLYATRLPFSMEYVNHLLKQLSTFVQQFQVSGECYVRRGRCCINDQLATVVWVTISAGRFIVPVALAGGKENPLVYLSYGLRAESFPESAKL